MTEPPSFPARKGVFRAETTAALVALWTEHAGPPVTARTEVRRFGA